MPWRSHIATYQGDAIARKRAAASSTSREPDVERSPFDHQDRHDYQRRNDHRERTLHEKAERRRRGGEQQPAAGMALAFERGDKRGPDRDA